MNARLWIRILSLVAGVTLIQFQACQNRECEEPLQDGLHRINYQIKEDGSDVFGTDEARKSLQVISRQTGQPFPFTFPENSYVGNGIVYPYFYINDDQLDIQARDGLICPEYILKYGTNDVDTLKICYKITYEDKCHSSRLDTVNIFLE